MAKEATITITAQLTAIERGSDKDYEKTILTESQRFVKTTVVGLAGSKGGNNAESKL